MSSATFNLQSLARFDTVAGFVVAFFELMELSGWNFSPAVVPSHLSIFNGQIRTVVSLTQGDSSPRGLEGRAAAGAC